MSNIDDPKKDGGGVLPGKSSVILPCAPDQFADFIGNLLGKPQVIERRFIGSLDIKFSDIENLASLLDHRLKEQNRAQLIQFTATLSYSDRSSVTLNSFEDFRSYAEIKDIETLQVTCSFEYLIKFHGVGHPERQSIDVTFSRIDRQQEEDFLDPLIYSVLDAEFKSSVFIRIKHTARSWGADIEALLSAHVQSMMRKESSVRVLARRFAGRFGIAAAGCVIAVSAVLANSLAQFLRSQQSVIVREVLSKIKDGASAAKFGIPLIIEQNTEHWTDQGNVQGAICVVLGIVLAIFIGGYLASALKKHYPTFLTFTKADEQRKPRVEKRYEHSIVYSIGALVLAVVCGVASNYIFYLLDNH
jgi:hypothetical protein